MVGNQVYTGVASECDNPAIRGELRSLDLDSGSILKRAYFVPEGSTGADIWQSPALTTDGSKLLISTGEDEDSNTPYTRAIVALDPNTLAILSSVQNGTPKTDDDWGTSPVIFHDETGRELVASVVKDGTAAAYQVNNLAAGPVWQRNTGVSVGLMPAYDPTLGNGGTLFIGTFNRLYALDPATGQDRWGPISIGQARGNIAVANGLIYMNISGSLYIVDETNGSILRVILPHNAGCSYSGVAIADGVIYWLSGSYLNAFGLPDPNGTPVPTSTTVPSPTPTPQGGPRPCNASFSDVLPGDFYYDSVRYLNCAGVISGYSDDTFRPFNETTRGQITKIVVLAFGIPLTVPSDATFVDVPADDPFFYYVETLAARGVLSGYCDGSFRPWASVTRGQLSKIIVAAAGWSLQIPDNPTFSDVARDNTFYAEIETAHAHGIISGYSDGTFRWGAKATRGQIAKIVYQAKQSVAKK